MLPYIITYIFSLFCFRQYDKSYGHNKMFLYIGVLALALLAGCRNLTIGSDTQGYVQSTFEAAVEYKKDFVGLYTLLVYSHGGFEELYILLNYIVAQFTDNINVYLFVSHLIIIAIMALAIKKIGINMTWAMFIFLMGFMSGTLNAARQSLAISFCYLAFALLITGSKTRWVLLTNFIAIGFHHSAFIFLVPVIGYKLVIKDYNVFCKKKIKILCVLGCVSFIWFFSEILSSVTDWGILDKKYVDRYGNSDMYGSNIPVSLIALTTFNLFAFYYSRKEQRKRNYIFFIYTEYILLMAFLLCFVALISTYAVRINDYFICLCVVFTTYITCQSKKNILKVATAVFYFFYWIMIVGIANLGDTAPYTSKILGIE